MIYEFPPDVDQLIRREMTFAGFASEDEVLRDALWALAERREVYANIEQGIQDLEAGRGRSLDEIDADIRRKYGISSQPDVTPEDL
jgi:Arc/MetJ-type ribon-helix-helix transcriptional regulator